MAASTGCVPRGRHGCMGVVCRLASGIGRVHRRGTCPGTHTATVRCLHCELLAVAANLQGSDSCMERDRIDCHSSRTTRSVHMSHVRPRNNAFEGPKIYRQVCIYVCIYNVYSSTIDLIGGTSTGTWTEDQFVYRGKSILEGGKDSTRYPYVVQLA